MGGVIILLMMFRCQVGLSEGIESIGLQGKDRRVLINKSQLYIQNDSKRSTIARGSNHMFQSSHWPPIYAGKIILCLLSPILPGCNSTGPISPNLGTAIAVAPPRSSCAAVEAAVGTNQALLVLQDKALPTSRST